MKARLSQFFLSIFLSAFFLSNFFTISASAYDIIFDGGTSANQFNGPTSDYHMSAMNWILNTSSNEITTPVTIGWYATPVLLTGKCDNTQLNPNSSWLLGTKTINTVISAGQHVNVALDPVYVPTILNVSVKPMPTGAFCLWAYANDIPNAIKMGSFFYLSPPDIAMADATYSYDSVTNFWTINGTIVSAMHSTFGKSSISEI